MVISIKVLFTHKNNLKKKKREKRTGERERVGSGASLCQELPACSLHFLINHTKHTLLHSSLFLGRDYSRPFAMATAVNSKDLSQHARNSLLATRGSKATQSPDQYIIQ